MFLFSWYFDFLCKFKIFNEPWSLDKMSFLLNLAYFFSCKIKDWNLKLAYASQFMQNMVVGSFIENIKTKIFIKFHFINFMTYLARVANSMVIFSASYIFQKKIIIVNRSLYECLNYHNKTIKKQTGHSKAPHPIPAFFYAAPRLWTRQWQVKR